MPWLARCDRVTPQSASWPLMGPQGAGLQRRGNRSRSRLAVTITLRSGERFGAGLVSVDDGVLIYERWDDAAGLPGGAPGMVEIEQSSEVRVE